MTTCPFCSEHIVEGTTKCPHCGEGLTPRPGRDGGELSEVLGWVFRDPEWAIKIIIGTVCLLAGCLLAPLFALQGYKFRIARQQQRAPGATPMPGWDQPGALIWDGLKQTISMCILLLLLYASVGLLWALGFLVDLATTGQPGPFAAIGFMVFVAGLAAGALCLTYFMPAIELEFLETGSPFASLHLGAVWRRVTTRPGDYFELFLYHFLSQVIGGLLSFLLYAPVTWGMFTQGAILGRYLARQRAKDAALGLDA